MAREDGPPAEVGRKEMKLEGEDGVSWKAVVKDANNAKCGST